MVRRKLLPDGLRRGYAGARPPPFTDISGEHDHWKLAQDNIFNGIIVRSGYDRHTTFATIIDGMSNVMVIGEKMLAYELRNWRLARRLGLDGWLGSGRDAVYGLSPFPDTRNNAAPDGTNVGYHFGGHIRPG